MFLVKMNYKFIMHVLLHTALKHLFKLLYRSLFI